MARPRKIKPTEPTELLSDQPVKATEKAVWPVLLRDPTSGAVNRTVRVWSAEELNRYLARGWVQRG